MPESHVYLAGEVKDRQEREDRQRSLGWVWVLGAEGEMCRAQMLTTPWDQLLTQSVQKPKKKLDVPFSSVEIDVDMLSSGSGVSMKMNIKVTHTSGFLDIMLVVMAFTAVREVLLAFVLAFGIQ